MTETIKELINELTAYLPLRCEEVSQSRLVRFLTDNEQISPMSVGFCGYLSFYQHCHVHEHRVELSDARLQTHDVLVP